MVYSPIEDDIEKLAPQHWGGVGFTADEEVIAGQLVKLSGDNAVAPSDTDGEQAFGIATQSVAAGDSVTVLVAASIANVRTGAAVTQGNFLASHGGTGEEGEVAPAATGDYYVGIALESIGDGEYGQALVLPGGQVN